MSNYLPGFDNVIELDQFGEAALREAYIKLRCSKCYNDDCLRVTFWRLGEPTTYCYECSRDDEATNLEIEEAS